MDVYVSGSAARAAFVNGKSLTYVDADTPTQDRIAKTSDLHLLFADASDVFYLPNSSRYEGLRRLLELCQRDRAIRLLDVVIDDEDDLLSEAIDCFEALLSTNEVFEAVEFLAYSMPRNIADRALSDTHPRTKVLFEGLASQQDQISLVRGAWDSIADDLFSFNGFKSVLEKVAVEKGLFKKLVQAISGNVAVDQVKLEALISFAAYKNHRAIIESWIQQLKFPVGRKAGYDFDLVTNPEEDWAEDEPQTEQTGSAQFENVMARLRAIVERLDRREFGNAKRFADELISDQIENNSSEFAAKSLCRLAQEAKKRGLTSLQLEWVLKATKVAPEDPWTHAQAGDAFLNLYRLFEARDHFSTAIERGDKHYGMIGLARVLQSSNQFEQALALFRDISDEFPESTFAIDGIGSTLREMGRLTEAFEVYEKAVVRFPEDSSLFCERAVTLSELGQYDEALLAFDDAIERFPKFPMGFYGKAGVLMQTGDLENALKVFALVVDRFPDEPRGYTGSADVLREMEQFDAALSSYDLAIKKFEFQPYGYAGKAFTLRDMNRLEDSLSYFDEAVRKFEYDVQLRNGKAHVLKSLGRFEEALRAFDQNVLDFPFNLSGLIGRANLLKELGSQSEALAAIDLVIARRPDYETAKVSKASILVMLKRYKEAIELLPSSYPRTKAEWIAHHIRGMIILKQGCVHEAVRYFEDALASIPFSRERKFFQSSLAVSKMKLGQFEEAEKIASGVSGVVANVVLLHSYAARGLRAAAQSSLIVLGQDTRPNVIVLRDEIARRFNFLPDPPAHDEDWIFDRETELITALAA